MIGNGQWVTTRDMASAQLFMDEIRVQEELRNVRVTDTDGGWNSELVDIEFSSTISSIRPAAEPDPARSRFVVPGLIDTHVHLGERE